MKKGNTVYEDRAEKDAARKAKRQARLEKHVCLCPHCGEKVLDHMTKCPHCGGELSPSGYTSPDSAKMKKIKIVTYTVGFAVAIALLVLFIVLK